jgi:hypothetical protein
VAQVGVAVLEEAAAAAHGLDDARCTSTAPIGW